MKFNLTTASCEAFALLAIALGTTCLAQPSLSTQDQAPTRTKIAPKDKLRSEVAAAAKLKPQSSLAPFPSAMLTNGRIDLAYSGHDPFTIFSALEAISSIRRGEFESSAEFEDRREKVLSAAYLPGLNLRDQLSFVVETKKFNNFFSGLAYSYDAGTGETSLYIVLPRIIPNEIGSPHYNANPNVSRPIPWPLNVQTLRNLRTDEQGYVGSNSFGATANVTKATIKILQLSPEKLDFIPWQRVANNLPQPIVKIKMEASVAARELPKLKAMYIARPTPPFVNYDTSHQEPTRENPSDITIQTRIIRVVVDEVVFYSGVTGEIIHRARPS